MKDFILDSTYKDATVVNSNDDIFITSSNNLPYNPKPHHAVNLNDARFNNVSAHSKLDKFNNYNVIDYLH